MDAQKVGNAKKYINSTMLVAIGNVSMRLYGLLQAIFFVRMVGDEAYGEFSYVLLTAALIINLFTFGIPIAAQLIFASSDVERRQEAVLAVMLITVAGVATSFFICLFVYMVGYLDNIKLYLLSFVFAFSSILFQIVLCFINGVGDYSKAAFMQVALSVMSLLSLVILYVNDGWYYYLIALCFLQATFALFFLSNYYKVSDFVNEFAGFGYSFKVGIKIASQASYSWISVCFVSLATWFIGFYIVEVKDASTLFALWVVANQVKALVSFLPQQLIVVYINHIAGAINDWKIKLYIVLFVTSALVSLLAVNFDLQIKAIYSINNNSFGFYLCVAMMILPFDILHQFMQQQFILLKTKWPLVGVNSIPLLFCIVFLIVGEAYDFNVETLLLFFLGGCVARTVGELVLLHKLTNKCFFAVNPIRSEK